MSFAPKPGCPMCSIVSSALSDPLSSPRSPTFSSSSTSPEVLWKDENFTAYRERAYPVSSRAHIVIAFNLHVPSIYSLSSTDLPLLVNVRNIGNRLLSSLSARSSSSPNSSPRLSASFANAPSNTDFHIGFITPPFKDNKIPVTDHLHAHAYIAPSDLLGWWRGVAYGPLAWYNIDDLIAEIRESVSNNRIKSGYAGRTAPIDLVPSAGSRTGTADGHDTSEPGLTRDSDLEAGESYDRPSTTNLLLPSSSNLDLNSPSSPALLSPQQEHSPLAETQA
jgi:hypothetical protein